MKKLISIFLALTLVLSMSMVASAATLSDNGWQDDDGQFDGWTLNNDGSMTLVYDNGSGTNDNRMWHSIENAADFEITVNVDFENNSRPVIKAFGAVISLNSEGGNGNQFNIQTLDASGSWVQHDWMNATECIATVKLVRENGGNLKVTVTGKDNATSATMELTPPEPNGNNLELAMYDCGGHAKGGVATFSVQFTAEQPPVEEPPAQSRPMSESGWWDDDGNYDGWTWNDNGSFTLVNGNGSGKSDNRIGHGIEDSENFEITVNVDFDNNSRPVIKAFGVIVSLNSEGGNGNQFNVQTLDASGSWVQHDWMNATECIATVKLVRENGGNVKVTVTGKDNATPATMELTVAEATGNNLELAMYDCGSHPQRGIATFAVDFGTEPENPENPKTGDIFGVIVALFAVSAMGIVVVSKKH